MKYGDYAELVTYRGITASLIWEGMADDTDLYCFHTFAGFICCDLKAETNEIDVGGQKSLFEDTNLQYVTKVNAGSDSHPSLKLIQGHFSTLFPGLQSKLFRFVHIDCDLYQTVLSAPEIFWPRLVTGGIILNHGYLSPKYSGIRMAVEELFAGAMNASTILPWCDRLGTAIVMKCGVSGHSESELILNE